MIKTWSRAVNISLESTNAGNMGSKSCGGWGNCRTWRGDERRFPRAFGWEKERSDKVVRPSNTSVGKRKVCWRTLELETSRRGSSAGGRGRSVFLFPACLPSASRLPPVCLPSVTSVCLLSFRLFGFIFLSFWVVFLHPPGTRGAQVGPLKSR